MNTKRLKILTGILVIILVATVAFGQTVVRAAQGKHGGGMGPMLGFYADALDLTDAQRAQMKDIMAKEKPTIQPLMQQLAQGHQQMRQLESADTFDEGKVRALATQQSQTMTELMVQKARIKSELVQLLTPDQKAKLAKMEARRQERFQRHLQPQAPAPSQQ